MAPDDLVEATDSGVRIVTAAPFEGWNVRPGRRAEVLYAGRRYMLAAAGTLGDRVVYFLEPWPDNLREIPRCTLAYEEGRAHIVVAEDLSRAPAAWQQVALVMLWPALGFLPASVKSWLDETHGIDPVEITRFSVFVEGVSVFSAASVVLIDLFTTVLPEAWLRGLLVGLVVVGLDALARYNVAALGGPRQPGFWEWLPDTLLGRRRF
jgi:hypothetical protein